MGKGSTPGEVTSFPLPRELPLGVQRGWTKPFIVLRGCTEEKQSARSKIK